MPDQATRMREIVQQNRRAARLHRPRLLAVTSGKGGVGKSTVSLNVAVTLSEADREVLLVDADTNLGSLDVMLGLAPRFRLGDLLRRRVPLQQVLVTAGPGLRLLPAGSGDVDHPALTPAAQASLLDELLSEEADAVIVDTGAGMHAEVLAYCLRADEILMVAGPEPASVMSAYAMMKTIWSLGEDARIRLVLNNVRSPLEAEETAGKLAMAVRHFLHRDLDLLGSVPADPAVAGAASRQQPVVKAFPRCAASEALQTLAARVMHQMLRSSERRSVPA